MPRVLLPVCLCLLFVLGASALAHAASSDGEVKGLTTQAVKDYRQNRFLKAEGRLRTALAVCRNGECSKPLEAKVWGYLGVVYAAGLEDAETASTCFQQMLALDPKAKPDAKLTNDAVDAAFAAALEVMTADERKAAAEAARKQEAAAAEKARVEAAQKKRIEEHQARVKELSRKKLEAEAQKAEEERLEAERVRLEDEALREADRKLRCDVEEPLQLPDAGWVEQAVGFPVPVFIKLPELPSDTMQLKTVRIEYQAPGKGPQALELSPVEGGYGGYLPCHASDTEGELTYVISLINDCGTLIGSSGSDAEPRRIKLKPAIDFKQPHLPGELPPESCSRGEVGMKCEFDDDCPGAGARCEDGVCRSAPPKIAPAERITVKRSRFSLLASLEFAPISSDQACAPSSVNEGQYSCFREDGSELEDNPSAPGSFSTVGVGSLRLSLGYDRILGDRWLVGARGGLTLLGHPERRDGKSVLPVHLEARGAVYFGNEPFARARVRAFAALSAGLAESAGRVDGVSVRSDAQGLEAVRVWQKGGSLFAGLGVGLELPVSDAGGILAELGARQYFPTSLTAFGLGLGYVHAL